MAIPDVLGRRAIAFLVALVGALAMLTVVSGDARAGSYDYYDYSYHTTDWRSRGVAHDYHYLRNKTSAGGYNAVCLRRNSGGQAFCGNQYIDKHYVDSCNPASCYSQYSAANASISLHDDWY